MCEVVLERWRSARHWIRSFACLDSAHGSASPTTTLHASAGGAMGASAAGDGAAGEAGDDGSEDGGNTADNGHADGGNAVDDGHEAVTDGVELEELLA